jgi:exosortase A
VAGRGVAAAGLLAATTVALLFLFRGTAGSIVSVWHSSADYAYGYGVIPVAAFLIWDRRAALAGRSPRSEPRALIAVAVTGLFWILGDVTGLQAVMQYALVGMILASWTAILGAEIMRAVAFPLGFLLFTVPFGDILLPALIETTVRLTMAACHLTGIPVVRHLSYLKIPGGEFQIVVTCAGLRFLTASVVLGYAYACLTFRSPMRRTLFLASSVAAAILANGFRVYSIVTIGYLSNMRSPLIHHHYTYGWFVFCIAMYLLFWLGSHFRESPGSGPPRAGAAGTDAAFLRTGAAVAGLALLLALPWPAYAAHLERHSTRAYRVALAAPEGAGGWAQAPQGSWDIDPHIMGTDASLNGFYGRGDQAVSMFVGFYAHPRQGAELIQAQNWIVEMGVPLWRVEEDAKRTVALSGRGTMPIRDMRLAGPQPLRLWVWYWVAGERTNSRSRAKLSEAWRVVRGGRAPEAVVVVGAPSAGGPEDAEATLAAFTAAMLPSIEASLAAAAGP